MTGIEDAAGDWPDRIEQVVTDQDRAADDETHALSKELRARQDDHARADGPDHLHHDADAPAELLDSPGRKTPGGGHDEPLDEDQPQAAREQERAQADGVLRDAIRPALVPARNTNTGAQKCVIQRVKKSAAPTPGLDIGSASPPKLKKSRT